MKKTVHTSLIVTIILLALSACTNSAPALPDTPSFKQGNQDGCSTARGIYTKNSELFRNDADYQDGWFYGRKHCNPAQEK